MLPDGVWAISMGPFEDEIQTIYSPGLQAMISYGACTSKLILVYVVLQHIFEHMHVQPRESHDVDFSRVRMWCINGHSKYYRQTLLFSSFPAAELNSLFNGNCFSILQGMYIDTCVCVLQCVYVNVCNSDKLCCCLMINLTIKAFYEKSILLF